MSGPLVARVVEETAAVELHAPVLPFNAWYWARRGWVLWWPVVRYRVPKHTGDRRWLRCVHHHPACDCREAELNEELAELRAEARDRRALVQRLRAIARLHTGAGWCPACTEQVPCSTRVLAVEALKAAHDWYPEDEAS